MGRKTWQSIGRALPGRRNIVVSRDPDFRAAGAETETSLDQAIALAGDAGRVHVIGGAEIYALALPIADTLELTEVDAEFPRRHLLSGLGPARFERIAHEARETPDGLRYAFATYRRRAAG